MKRIHSSRHPGRQRASALLMVMSFLAISAIILAGALRWVSSNARMTDRNNEYFRAVASAEAATEKALAQISYDFQSRNAAYVNSRLSYYRSDVPNTTESGHWAGWTFSDPAGGTNGIYVSRDSSAQFVELESQYSGLKGMATSYSIIANARQTSSENGVIAAGVRQQFQLATIPIFQFAIFYGILMEIHPGPTFNVIGRVHSNDSIYYSSSSGLNFRTHVTSVGNMYNAFAPGDNNHTGTPGNNVRFYGEAEQKTAQLQLPIGTNNTAAAVRQILMPPPSGESPTSAMGQQRYYNKSDVVITVDNSGVRVSSGRYNNFATTLATNDWQKFVSTGASFKDWREEKVVKPVDIDVAAFRSYVSTNTGLYTALGNRVADSIYVDDQRTVASTELGAVRVYNGAELPVNGLTVATAKPLYVKGNFNQPVSAHLGTTNTSGTKPASFASDAINVLSDNWSDLNSFNALLSLRPAANTTVNAAFLSGIVPTLDSNRSSKYSGGVENYPRFLEHWGGKTLTYNGSMVVLFNSQYATNGWKYGGSVYEAPNRNWSFDLNFLDDRKLPPGTPQLTALIRGHWSVVPAGSTNTVASVTVVGN